nr:hypothetical protein FEE99_25845 [Pseudomonas sp. ef1]
MINLFWRIIAKVLARPDIADWLIANALRTPPSTSKNNERADHISRLILSNETTLLIKTFKSALGYASSSA